MISILTTRTTLFLIHLNTTARSLTTLPHPSPMISPFDPAQLLRVSTVLFQLQNSPFPKLQTRLQNTRFELTHEFFLQICNKFPLSWRPVYRFYEFTLTRQPEFTHTTLTMNRMLDVVAKSRNMDLLWEMVNDMARRGLVDGKSVRVAVRGFAKGRELKKCVEVFDLMRKNGFESDVGVLNAVVESLRKDRLVDEAKHVVVKLRDWIKPDRETYKCLICGFCDRGDMVEGSKMWNAMVDDGFEADVEVSDKMMETFFKKNEFGKGLKLFQMMRVRRMEELGVSTYRLVIGWLCNKGKIGEARAVFDEMLERGIPPDNVTLGSMVYGFVSKNRIREAYLIMERIRDPDISVYHGLIKGLLRVKRAGEATEVFREMIRKGIEPIMHTYVMLLQGHLGKKGRKGRDPLVNFDTIFVGGLVKAGKCLEATKYVERVMRRGSEVPRFDYNKFLHYYSNKEGVAMFQEIEKKLREVGLFDLADIFVRYGEKMATRDRRRNREIGPVL
ncbi:hypothetical protein Droror1_Dr00003469 [Drosera rotundifolia]